MSRSIGKWLNRFSQRRFSQRSRLSRRRSFAFEPLESRVLLHGEGPDHDLGDHVHHHLAIFLEGEAVDIPADIGVDASGNIFAEVHTHDPDGLLHVHPLDGVPPADFPTLDDFFSTWRTNAGAAGNNPDAFFSSTQLMDHTVDANHRIVMFVNGVESDEFEDYQMHDGDQIVLSFEEIPGLNDPVFNPVNDVTMAAGKTFIVPLDAFDPNDEDLTYTVSSDNTDVTAEIITGGRSVRLNVSGTDDQGNPFTGELVLRLFEDLAPETTSRIIEIVESGFYNGKLFHRILNGFMAQGGALNPNGTGGTGTQFADEFTELLAFTGFGQLAMANAGDDTNDSQLFLTDTNLSLNMQPSPGQLPPQHLNFNHTIFGQLVSGFDVFDKLIRTPVEANPSTGEISFPVSDVTINTATVFTDNQNGVLRISAPDGFTGEANVTVTATNTSGLSAERTFGVEVRADEVDDRAFLGPVSNLVTAQNTPIVFQVDGTDLEGDDLSFVVRSASNFAIPPSNVAVSINQVDADTAEITLTPDANFFGTIAMLIGVRDQTARGGTERNQFDTQQIALTVNDAPTLDAVGHRQTDEDTNLVFSVSGTDSEGDELTFVVRDANDFSVLPPNLSVNVTPLTNDTSRLTITPDPDFNGTVDVIIGVRDQTARGDLPLDDPSQFITEQITITVNAVDDAPTADNQNLATNQNTAVAIALVADDGDPELDQPLTFEIVDQPTNGTISDFDPDAGTLTYTPDTDFFGIDTFTFRVLQEDNTPSNTAQVSIAVNDPAMLDTVDDQTIDEDTPLMFEISATDPEGDELTFVVGAGSDLSMAPANVTVQITTIDPSTREVTITPDANFNGTVELLIGVRDQTARGGLPLNDPAQFDTQLVTLTINAVNDAPTANPADLSVGSNTALEIQLEGDDVDLDPLTFALVDQPTGGTLSGFDPSTGQVTYTPNTGFDGVDTFTFTVNDGTETSDPATVTITVSGDPVMDPVADQTTAEDTAITFDITATDSDTDNLTFVIRDANNFAQLPPNVAVSIENVDRTTRRVTLTPSTNFNGTVELIAGVSDESDAGDISDFDTQTFMLTVTAVNDRPTASGQTIEVQAGASANIQLSGNDVDANTNLTFSIVNPPTAGTLVQFDPATGAVVYEPGSRFTGSDRFSFQVSDGELTSDPATVTINGRTNAPIRAAQLKGKTLKIKGSDAADQIDIRLNDTRNMLVVQLNSNPEQLIPLRSVKRIKVYGRDGDDVISIAADVPVRAKVKGGDGNDAISGGAHKDRLYGNDGNDTINGGGGDDKIRGGDDNDSLIGGAGDDNIKGQRGDDQIEGGDGDDRLRGNKGNDTILGGAGNDKIRGGRGNDVEDQDGVGQDDGGGDELPPDPFRPLPIIPVGTQGSLSDPSLLGERSDLRPGAPSADQLFAHNDAPIDYIALGITSNPPTYGPHVSSAAAPVPVGVHTTVQLDEHVVHNLEHGHVWISYDPGLLSGTDISELERLVRSFGDEEGVVLSPRPANDTAIALVSWNRLLTLGSFDAQQIREFAEANRAHAPEGYDPD